MCNSALHFLKGRFRGSCSSCVAVCSLSTFPLTPPGQPLLFYTILLSTLSERLILFKMQGKKRQVDLWYLKCRDVYKLEGKVMNLILTQRVPLLLQVSKMFVPEGNEWESHRAQILAMWTMVLAQKANCRKLIKGKFSGDNCAQAECVGGPSSGCLNWISVFCVFVAVVHASEFLWLHAKNALVKAGNFGL